MKIILGSQSPYRKKVLTEMGYDFEVMPPYIDEKAIRFDDPRELTLALANAKADALLSRIVGEALLITSDQVVVCNGKILEKPENEEETYQFLRNYSTYPAVTVTAVAVTNVAVGKRVHGIDEAHVFFYPFSDEVIARLIETGEPFNSSGGFALEGLYEPYIQYIHGERESVMGLPKMLTQRLLQESEKI